MDSDSHGYGEVCFLLGPVQWRDDVTICAKTTVTCLKNIQVAPVHEKLTVTVPKGKEAGILGAFPCAIQIGSLIFKVPPQLEEVRPNFRTPPEKVLI